MIWTKLQMHPLSFFWKLVVLQLLRWSAVVVQLWLFRWSSQEAWLAFWALNFMPSTFLQFQLFLVNISISWERIVKAEEHCGDPMCCTCLLVLYRNYENWKNIFAIVKLALFFLSEWDQLTSLMQSKHVSLKKLINIQKPPKRDI